jgi:hypothetical protein
MRRVLTVIAVSLLGVLSLAGPASAAPGQVTHFRYNGTFAEADWFVTSGDTFSDTFLNVSKSRTGSQLFLQKFVGHTDSEGEFLGGTQTSVDVPNGFAFTIDASKLTSATVQATDLPATVCEIDADGNVVEPCESTTVDVSASWTGVGPTSRSVSNSHFSTEGFRINDHFSGTGRDAVAAGTVAGSTLTADELQFASLGKAKSGTTKFCIDCPEELGARR